MNKKFNREPTFIQAWYKCENVSGSRLRPSPKAGERKVLTVSGIDYAFHWCPPGEFMMGSPQSEWDKAEIDWKDYDEKWHKVKLTCGFWLLETQVTVGMFESFVQSTGYESRGNKPYGWTGCRLEQNAKYSWRNSGFYQKSTHPVTCVSWNDAQEFCKWLGQQIGRVVQLPTEAQWEYACRAGTMGEFAGNPDQTGWHRANSGLKIHEVGLKNMNLWGLCDMHGNVSEWCSDRYATKYYFQSPTSDPTGPKIGRSRVCRGGSWINIATCCRSACRYWHDPEDRYVTLGLRVLMLPIPKDYV